MAVFIVALIAIAVVYVLLTVLVLPKLLFRTRYAVSKPIDRGIKKIEGEESGALVFEPSQNRTAEYISRYALENNDGKRVLSIKLKKKLDYIDYDVVVFGESGKAAQAFNVKEAVNGNEYTRPVELPGDTEYVTIIINETDDCKFKFGVFKNVAPGWILLFILLSAALTVAAAIGVKVCLAYMFGGIFRESFLIGTDSAIVTFIIVGAAVAFDAAMTVIAFVLRRAVGGRHKL